MARQTYQEEPGACEGLAPAGNCSVVSRFVRDWPASAIVVMTRRIRIKGLVLTALLLGGCGTLTEQSAVSSTPPTSRATVIPGATSTLTPVPTIAPTPVPTIAPTPVPTPRTTATPLIRSSIQATLMISFATIGGTSQNPTGVTDAELHPIVPNATCRGEILDSAPWVGGTGTLIGKGPLSFTPGTGAFTAYTWSGEFSIKSVNMATDFKYLSARVWCFDSTGAQLGIATSGIWP